jgi:alkanesulfonate monooxygenase SsuD/methylene tetrahydromethanopterin reductase-like flavin-dependent oxidoreductase (luciferase family)
VAFWIAGSTNPAIARAARLADGWIGRPGSTLIEAGEQATFYLRSCEEFGRAPGVVAIRRDIHVASTNAKAASVVAPVLSAGYRESSPIVPIVGSVELVTESFARLASMGYTDVLIRHIASDQEAIFDSFQHLAEVRRLVAEL